MITRRSLIKAGIFGACSLCLGNNLTAWAEDVYIPESLKGINQGFPVKEAKANGSKTVAFTYSEINEQ